jgi:hypothetical protein
MTGLLIIDDNGQAIQRAHQTYRKIMRGKTASRKDFENLIGLYLCLGSPELALKGLREDLEEDCKRNGLDFTVTWKKVGELICRECPKGGSNAI